MKVRLISSAVGIAAIIALLFAATVYPVAIDIAISIVTAVCIGEALHAGNLLKNYSVSVPFILFGLLLPFFISTVYLNVLLYLFVLAVFVVTVFCYKKVHLPDICFAATFTLLISFGMSSLITLFYNDRQHTVFYTVIGLAMPWLSDSGAYFAGVFLGKHKLCPEISPKKTVEGAIGGVISGAVLIMLVGIIFEKLIFPSCQITDSINYINIFIYGFVCSFISIIGDLTFSLLKRNYGIKDFGSIIPGHGGLLDRLDSVIFTLPALCVISPFLPILI